MQNTFYIKVKFLPCTNTKPDRVKFIQSNNRKTLTISQGKLPNLDYLQALKDVINKCISVNNCSVLIDNTAAGNDGYLFLLDYNNNGYGFPNIIDELREVFINADL